MKNKKIILNKIIVSIVFFSLSAYGSEQKTDPDILIDYNNPKAQERLEKTEIKSLEESIQNDKKVLKLIEEKGSGIEEYKLIKKNMEKRKKRLKELKRK